MVYINYIETSFRLSPQSPQSPNLHLNAAFSGPSICVSLQQCIPVVLPVSNPSWRIVTLLNGIKLDRKQTCTRLLESSERPLYTSYSKTHFQALYLIKAYFLPK